MTWREFLWCSVWAFIGCMAALGFFEWLARRY